MMFGAVSTRKRDVGHLGMRYKYHYFVAIKEMAIAPFADVVNLETTCGGRSR